MFWEDFNTTTGKCYIQNNAESNNTLRVRTSLFFKNKNRLIEKSLSPSELYQPTVVVFFSIVKNTCSKKDHKKNG